MKNRINKKDDIAEKNVQSAKDEIEDYGLKDISIVGARVNNLKNVSVKIPRDKFVVVTGLSGSGKSSLAFDTLYAEGQRRYVECLSVYAKQYLNLLKKPEVDRVEGLSPAISIEQKSISHNPRSTVGTVTEIYDYLRLLFAKIGIQYCTECNIPVVQKSLDQIVDDILKLYNEQKIQILAPIVKARKGHYRDLFENMMAQGFTKVKVDGKVQDIVEGMELSRYKIHDIELVVDRCVVEAKQELRISESVDLALRKGNGIVNIMYVDDNSGLWREKMYSTSNTCPQCGRSYHSLSPNMFSFNSPYGACPECDGIGEIVDFSDKLVIPDNSLSVEDGGIAPLGKKRDMWLWNQVETFAEDNKIPLDKPLNQLTKEQISLLLYGNENEIQMSYSFAGQTGIIYRHKYIGILPSLKHHYETTSSPAIKKSYEAFMAAEECSECHGGRLKQENLFVRVKQKSIKDLVGLDMNDAISAFEDIRKELSSREEKIAGVIIKEIISRMKFLNNVGLSYLTLNRTLRTLSGGESQRIRLASQIGSELVGILYVLDEPSIGLHQHDNNKLIESLKDLRDLGNSVVVVEHDKAMIEESDYLIDLGPKAGVNGGEIVFQCAPKDVKLLPKEIVNRSLTAQYLLNIKRIEIPGVRRDGNGKHLILKGANGNNLQNVDLDLPLGKFICVTGMSGSGKSSLINDTLVPILSKHFYRSIAMPLSYKSIEGLENLDKIIEIDQTPIGRTPRSNPATYTGLFTIIRDFFAMMPESKIRGYKAGRFSFNLAGGRCEVCEGGGIKKIEMNFLPDVYVVCDECDGKRYNTETLAVKYKGKSIADVLDMTVDEANDFFSEIPKIKSKLSTLKEVGLGYIKLGQQAPTLSGGEAQRVKLATELSKIGTGKTIYLLDEPTTGLHFEDVNILLNLLYRLVDKGNTVVVIEHNLDVIKCADWIIDLGPEGGKNGGEIIAVGTPEEIIKVKKSYTGKYLKDELKV